MWTAPSNSTPDAAFTLMELVVVIALIAILSAVIIPEMRGTYDDALLRSSSRQFIDVFGLANARAVSLNQTCRVRLDRSAGRFVLEKQVGRPARGVAPTFVPMRDVSGGEGTINPRITCQIEHSASAPGGVESPPADVESLAAQNENSITFYPDGTADASQLTLRDRAGFRLTLRLNPVTARVQVTQASPP